MRSITWWRNTYTGWRQELLRRPWSIFGTPGCPNLVYPGASIWYPRVPQFGITGCPNFAPHGFKNCTNCGQKKGCSRDAILIDFSLCGGVGMAVQKMSGWRFKKCRDGGSKNVGMAVPKMSGWWFQKMSGLRFKNHTPGLTSM